MRVEDRTGVMKDEEDKNPNIICICEDEAESQIVDLLGKPGSKVFGELHLADGYGEFYIRLEPLNPGKYANKVREYIFKKYGDVPVNKHPELLEYLIKYTSIIDCQQAENEKFRNVINEVIELMDEEPAKEILRKAVTNK